MFLNIKYNIFCVFQIYQKQLQIQKRKISQGPISQTVSTFKGFNTNILPKYLNHESVLVLTLI